MDEKKREKRKMQVVETALMYWVVNAWDANDEKSIELLDEFAYENNLRQLFGLTNERVLRGEGE